MITQAEVLIWLRPEIAAEFDCVRGPHEWVTVSAATRTWKFCKHCPRKRRIEGWPDTPHHQLAGLGWSS